MAASHYLNPDTWLLVGRATNSLLAWDPLGVLLLGWVVKKVTTNLREVTKLPITNMGVQSQLN